MGKVIQLEDERKRRQQRREFNPWGLFLYAGAAASGVFWVEFLMALEELSK